MGKKVIMEGKADKAVNSNLKREMAEIKNSKAISKIKKAKFMKN